VNGVYAARNGACAVALWARFGMFRTTPPGGGHVRLDLVTGLDNVGGIREESESECCSKIVVDKRRDVRPLVI